MKELTITEAESVCGGNGVVVRVIKRIGKAIRDGLIYETAKEGASQAIGAASLRPGSHATHHAPCPGMCHPAP